MLIMSKPTSEYTVASQVPECIHVSLEKPVREANKAGTVHITQHCTEFAKPLLQ